MPIRPGTDISKGMSPNTPKKRDHMSKVSYVSAIESLMYAMICTKSDIAYTISVTKRHWIVVKHILKYLKRTKDMLLVYGDGNIYING